MTIVHNLITQIVILAVALILASILSKYFGDSEFWLIKHLYARITNLNSITLLNSSIPVVDYGYYKGMYIGPQINPITVSDRVLGYYEKYKDNPSDVQSKQSVISGANWLAANAVRHDNYSIFEYKFPWPTYNLVPPWHSGMAQGKALQALIKAHEITLDDRFLVAGKRILNSFYVPVDQGGVTYKNEENSWWYEEYASKGGTESRVLNGMMYTLLGLYDYYQYTGDNSAKTVFDNGINALKSELHEYDDNGYSYYDILKTPAGVYHNIHIELLSRLFNLTNEKIFEEYHNRWQNFKEPFSIVVQLQHPSSPSFLVLIGNFIIAVAIMEIVVIYMSRRKRNIRDRHGMIKQPE